jgi:hypothetical protein
MLIDDKQTICLEKLRNVDFFNHAFCLFILIKQKKEFIFYEDAYWLIESEISNDS